MILSQVIQILVIFHKSPLKFCLTMKIRYFCNIQCAISRQQSKRFEFRKKQQLPLIKPYHICSNWKIDQKDLPPPLPSVLVKITQRSAKYWFLPNLVDIRLTTEKIVALNSCWIVSFTQGRNKTYDWLWFWARQILSMPSGEASL